VGRCQIRVILCRMMLSHALPAFQQVSNSHRGSITFLCARVSKNPDPTSSSMTGPDRVLSERVLVSYRIPHRCYSAINACTTNTAASSRQACHCHLADNLVHVSPVQLHSRPQVSHLGEAISSLNWDISRIVSFFSWALSTGTSLGRGVTSVALQDSSGTSDGLTSGRCCCC
jgi:hypothetical protein